jgi:hypothetical protein
MMARASPTESWFNSFKNERVHGIRYATHAKIKATAFEYIKVFYNRKRQHSTLGYRSPVQFQENWISERAASGKTGSVKFTLWQTKNRGNLTAFKAFLYHH